MPATGCRYAAAAAADAVVMATEDAASVWNCRVCGDGVE